MELNEMSTVRLSYDGGLCPDCGEDIPIDAPEGYSCHNCGHACFSEDDMHVRNRIELANHVARRSGREEN